VYFSQQSIATGKPLNAALCGGNHMHIFRLTLLLSAVHLLVVIITFIFFGIGLEGKRNFGNVFLWMLLQPGASLPGAWFLILPMNSLLWGFCSAVLFKVSHRLFSKSYF
jgi:hypothetical protein